MEHPIKAQAMLWQLSPILVKYQAHAVEIRNIYAALMEKHRFPYANTFEELFIQLAEYEKSHPFKWYFEMIVRKFLGDNATWQILFYSSSL